MSEGVLVEGFVGGGCFGEGKGDGGNLEEFLSLWWNKWRWRRKKMVKCYKCCYCCSCSEDEGGVGDFRILMEE